MLEASFRVENPVLLFKSKLSESEPMTKFCKIECIQEKILPRFCAASRKIQAFIPLFDSATITECFNISDKTR